MNPHIVLLRQDLRLTDNPALWHAAQTGAPLILLYILDDDTPGKWKIGQAQRWWLHHSLEHLTAQLAKQQTSLILRKGNTLKILSEILRQTQAKDIYYNRCYEPFWMEMEKSLVFPNVKIHSFNSALLSEPEAILTKQGTPYKVFTQFWNTLSKELNIQNPFPIPVIKPYLSKTLQGDSLASWNLLPKNPDWAEAFSKVWEPGEGGAFKKLENFRKAALDTYSSGRDIPSKLGTSLLSPHLHFGEIGPAQIIRYLEHAGGDVEDYVRELGWREFTYYSLFHYPNLPELSFQNHFKQFPWDVNEASLQAWQKGLVGYPIVDAGMRQLWKTGWMHNRVRMIVGSFLTKDLLIPWQEGQKWFWETLVDADLASNAFNWQWIAGCGMDAAPFFRIFNPVLQGKKFDPEGTYIKTWIPELANMPLAYIHEPWLAPPLLLRDVGITIGKTYPYPIVDHGKARNEALKHFKSLRDGN